jgi:hypothetical protein
VSCVLLIANSEFSPIVTSKPDYYTVFGLRKYIDIADDLALDREQRPSHASPKKKRKMQQKADENL